MNDLDLSILIVGEAGEGIRTVGDVVSRTCGFSGPQHDSAGILVLNSTDARHYKNTASSNCLALGESSPGGEGIAAPFQAFAKEQFGSPLYDNSSRIEQLPLEWMHNKTHQTKSISGTSISKEDI